jgi:hypothetical protein
MDFLSVTQRKTQLHEKIYYLIALSQGETEAYKSCKIGKRCKKPPSASYLANISGAPH